jgi:adenosylcobinamide amidohydrolase
LSWATVGGGVSREQRYVCAEVRNADLPLGVEPRAVIARFLSELQCDSGVVALTSADIAKYRTGFVRDGEVCAAALVTAGLANALRVGEPSAGPPRRYLPDTINLVCWVNVPLTLEAQLEALSIVTQARTLEVLKAEVPSLEQNGFATGTGTDCITLFSSDEGSGAANPWQLYAGMHTTVGRVLGRATREAVALVVSAWLAKARANATLSR